jgi:hypothetical protein
MFMFYTEEGDALEDECKVVEDEHAIEFVHEEIMKESGTGFVTPKVEAILQVAAEFVSMKHEDECEKNKEEAVIDGRPVAEADLGVAVKTNPMLHDPRF